MSLFAVRIIEGSDNRGSTVHSILGQLPHYTLKNLICWINGCFGLMAAFVTAMRIDASGKESSELINFVLHLY